MRYINFEPERHPDGSLELISTSKQTAMAPPIDLRDETDQYRFRFVPSIASNGKNPTISVRGKLVYEKKGKHAPLFPTDDVETVSKNDIRMGDSLEIELRSDETRRLYEGLTELYRLAGNMDELPSGVATYVEVDSAAKSLLTMLRSDPSAARMLADQETFDLVRELIKLLTQGTSHDELGRILSELETKDLGALTSGLSLEVLKRAAQEIEDNFENTREEFWQAEILEKYPWIISQLFSTPCLYFGSKMHLGGKSIDNHGGNIIDFIYQNELTNNLALVEIKPPSAKLLGQKYREHCFSLSTDLSGAVNQVLSYRHSLLTDFANLVMNSPGRAIEAFNPQCVVILGSTREFDKYDVADKHDAIGTFENYRNALSGVSIVTFDELLQKIKDLISILGGSSI